MCFGSACKVCEDFYGIWYMKGNGDTSFPCSYDDYYRVTMDLRILCQMKKDILLLEYLERNEELYKKNFCYITIAHHIAEDIFSKSNKFYESQYENIVRFIVDHLYYAFGSAYDENNELKKRYNYLRENEIKEKYRILPVKLRIGQEQYRKDLIYVHKTCQLCGMEHEELLIASHIKDYSKSDNKECVDFENGLLLCRNHDGVFDRGLITFTDEGEILISSNLNEEDIEKLDILEGQINLSEKQKEYMQWHRENKFK